MVVLESEWKEKCVCYLQLRAVFLEPRTPDLLGISPSLIWGWGGPELRVQNLVISVCGGYTQRCSGYLTQLSVHGVIPGGTPGAM